MTDTSQLEGYPLARDHIDSARLNLQHYLWKDVFGYLIHPKIPLSSKNLRVADIGTGTGVWLVDLSRHVASDAQLDGIDVDLSQAGPPQGLPQNISLRQWSAFEPVPEDLVGQYDVVHIRLFLWVLGTGDPVPVLRAMLKLLKPGGWLQWGEPDTTTMSYESIDPSVSSSAIEQIFTRAGAMAPQLRPPWPKELPRLFREEGLLEVEHDYERASPFLARGLHDCNLLLFPTVLSRMKDQERVKGVSEMYPEALAETKAGAYMTYTRISVVGRKPGAT